MNIVVIDAQGGGIGKQLISQLKKTFPEETITAIGTNSIATSAMLRAGADFGATGENSAIVACRNADIIVGPIGIIIADAMIGEITPKMARHITQSKAARVLIPFNNCNTYIAGVPVQSTGELIKSALERIGELIRSE